jgi:hypothetical protein
MAFVCSCQDILAVDICNALTETQQAACEWGTPIVYVFRKEHDVIRDELGTIKKRSLDTKFTFNALPVERYPDYKKLERAGVKEGVEVLVYTPMATWMEYGFIRQDKRYLGFDFAAIDTIRSTVIVDGIEMKIKDKGLSGRLSWMPLYVTLGLSAS